MQIMVCSVLVVGLSAAFAYQESPPLAAKAQANFHLEERLPQNPLGD